jgi:hypothetical protein
MGETAAAGAAARARVAAWKRVRIFMAVLLALGRS